MAGPTGGRGWLGLLVVALVHVGVLAGLGAQLRVPHHDDAISLLAATGHLAEYRGVVGAYSGGTPEPPLPAGELQRLWRVEREGAWGTIRRDLAALDIHPPLYFWLLHGSLLLGAEGVGAGVAVNAVVGLLLLVSLFLLVRRLCSARVALVACALWAVSPGALDSALGARPYALLGLLTVWTAAASVPILVRGDVSARRGLALALLAFLGVLTHYHFTLVLAATGAMLLWRDRTSDAGVRSFIRFAGWSAAGVAVALLVHPDVHLSFERQADQLRSLDLGRMLFRSVAFPTSVATAVVPHDLFLSARDHAERFAAREIGGLVPALTLGVAGAALLLSALRSTPPDLLRERVRTVARRLGGVLRDRPELGALGIPVLLALMQYALYVAGRSPFQALGGRYFAPLWPFVALGVAAWIVRRRSRSATVGIALLLAFALYGARSIAERRHFDTALRPAIEAADLLVVDDARRGYLPRFLWHAPRDTPVLLTDPSVAEPALRSALRTAPSVVTVFASRSEPAVLASPLLRSGYRLRPLGDVADAFVIGAWAVPVAGADDGSSGDRSRTAGAKSLRRKADGGQVGPSPSAEVARTIRMTAPWRSGTPALPSTRVWPD